MISARTIGLASMALRIGHFGPILKRRMQHAFDKQAQEAVDAMQERVPVEKGALQASIRWEEKTEEHQAGVKITAGGTPETEHFDAKNGVTYDEALLLEYGTLREEAQPFFRPVIREVFGDESADNIKAGIGDLNEGE
jgi:HK97 gp10 family phage protein